MFFASPSVLPPENSMPTASALLAPSPSNPCVKEKLRTRSEDLAGNTAGVEDFRGVGQRRNRSQLWLPGDHRGRGGGCEGADDVGIRGVDDLDVALAQRNALERARQQVMRHRELHQIDRLAL